MIPYGRHEITKEDIEAVIKVLESDFLTQGPQVPKFEEVIANYCGAEHAIAVNSATSALHLACLALGLAKGDHLWTSPISFVASANCGHYCGANVDFVDIDPDTYNLCPKALERKLSTAKKEKCLPKIVIPVHLAGQSCDMESINSLSKEYGFKIIEDASHAIGGKYLDQPIGSCNFSDVAVFSFHPVKIITSAEGGIATTRNTEIAEKMLMLRTHGIIRNENQMTRESDGDWYYEQLDLGYNFRMNDLQAALGISQFNKLEKIVSRRHYLAERYDNLLSDFPIKLPFQNPNSFSSYHLYPILLNDVNKHKRVFSKLRAKGIGVNLHYIPIYRHPYYKKDKQFYNSFPMAEMYYSRAITIPLYPALSEHDQDFVIESIAKLI